MPLKKGLGVANINAAAAVATNPAIAKMFEDREKAHVAHMMAEVKRNAHRRVRCIICGPDERATLYHAGLDGDGRQHYGCNRHKERVEELCREHREKTAAGELETPEPAE